MTIKKIVHRHNEAIFNMKSDKEEFKKTFRNISNVCEIFMKN